MSKLNFSESLTVEFKSDEKKLSDDVIIDSVVAFANTSGGKLYLGVENDGRISGLHKDHKDITRLAAYIANKTVPPIAVSVEIVDGETDYLIISVRQSRSIVASSSGKILRRRLKANGEPENVPMYPHEINSRLSSLSLLDFSSLPVPESKYEDLSSVERERLRSIILAYDGEKNLLELSDEELDKALRLVTDHDGKLIPTYTGMLLIGQKDRIAALIPTVEMSFQVLQGTHVLLNDTFVMPLLAAFERIETYMSARNSEVEVECGLFRISVPDFDKRAFREAVVNAFCHRDYTMLGRVRIQLDESGLTISNPGGFIEGISVDNLLSAEPQGRNPALADAFKRIGLAERTGRGIDRIYEGSLIYGRPLPDYSDSNNMMVKLFIPRGLPDKAFVEMIATQQSKLGRAMPVNTLLVLNALKQNRRMSVKELSEETHIAEARIKATTEALIEAGLIEASGTGKGRSYILSAKMYKQTDNTAGYVRQTGIDTVRYPELIMKYAKNNQGTITRYDVQQLLQVSAPQSYRLLRKLTVEGKLELVGKGKGAYYKVK